MPRASSSRKSSSDASRPSSRLQLLAMASPMGSTSEPAGQAAQAPSAFDTTPIEPTSLFTSGLHISVPRYKSSSSSSSKSAGNKGKDKAARQVPLALEPVYHAETTPAGIDEAPFSEGPIYEAPIDEAPIYEAPIYGTSIVESPIVETPPVCQYCRQFMTLEPRDLHSIMEPMCIDCDRKYLVSGGSGGAGRDGDGNGGKKGGSKGGSKSGSKSKSGRTGQRKSFWSFFG
ncbi:hypothetical protein B0J18DRAFT_488372 [Chaetomium sp. MPI-SDFR-AT-0129]|nr:hypothetical protein B0J18DRAFT_488372 [Chaetomium sp. MPI-SDFR-AT-0129]